MKCDPLPVDGLAHPFRFTADIAEMHAKLVKRLRKAEVTSFMSKDVFRASQLSLLGVSNSHVAKDTAKILQGLELSPLLLVRDESLGKVIIADGYHRLCAVYALDEDAVIPCKIV